MGFMSTSDHSCNFQRTSGLSKNSRVSILSKKLDKRIKRHFYTVIDLSA